MTYSNVTASTSPVTLEPICNFPRNERGETKFYEAAQEGNVALMETLMEEAGPSGKYLVHVPDFLGATPLIPAAQNGHMEAVKFLVKKGANINAQLPAFVPEFEGASALRQATQNRHSRIVAYLLKKGANPNIQDKKGATPLLLAAQNGDLPTIKVLVLNGARVNEQGNSTTQHEGKTALMQASLGGYTDIVAYLIEKGANPNLKDKNGITPLYCAAQGGNLEVLKLLTSAGAQRNVPVTTRLKFEDNPEVLKLIGNEAGNAAQNNQVAALKYLLETGSEISRDISPLIFAAQNGHTAVIELLLQFGADVNTQHRDIKITALHMAAENGHKKIVKLLLKKGANPSLESASGKTPDHYAELNGFTEIAYLLRGAQLAKQAL
jgi:ankyrin repeat protein